MATSNSTNLATTRDALVTAALRVIGGIAQGESPTTDQLTEGVEALNFMVKAFEADGMPLWAIREYSIPLTTGQISYRLGDGQVVNTPKPLKIIQAYFHNGASSVDIPMIIMTREEYNRLGNKTVTGMPIQLFYDPQRTYGDIYLYPAPDATYAGVANYVRIVYQRPFEDFDSSVDEPDFPQEWFEAIKFNLALRLAPEYGVPTEQYSIIKNLAKETKDAALMFGTEEGSFSFEIDRRPW